MHLPAAQSLFVATYTVDGASLTASGHQVAADAASGRIPRSVLPKPEQHVAALHQQVLDLLAGSCPARYARPEAGRPASVWTADARRSDDVASKLDVGTSCTTWLVEPDIGAHSVLGSQSSGDQFAGAVVWADENMGVIVSSSPTGTRSMPTIRSMIMFWKRCSGSSKR
jgi:hypothetical protein